MYPDSHLGQYQHDANVASFQCAIAGFIPGSLAPEPTGHVRKLQHR